MKLAIFDELLTKEMTRKEFLLHVGLLLLMITGITGLLKTLSNPHLIAQNSTKKHFGSGAYGG